MENEEQRIFNALRTSAFNDFCQKNRISLALLFGSQATGQSDSDSDFDIALLLDKHYPREIMARAGYKQKIIHNLISFLSTSRLDITILNDASPYMLYRVVQEGKVLYEAEDGEFARLASLAVRQYSDGFVFREAEKKYLSGRF